MSRGSPARIVRRMSRERKEAAVKRIGAMVPCSCGHEHPSSTRCTYCHPVAREQWPHRLRM